MTYDYVVAGVRLVADQPISGINTQGNTDAVVAVHIGDLEQLDIHECYSYPDDTAPFAFFRRDGQAIWLQQADGAMVRLAVPFAAALQGKITFHASAVCYQSNVYAFIGASGAGKSTLARAFASHGLTVIADDLLACRIMDNQIVALEGQRPLVAIYFLSRQDQAAHWQLSALNKKQSLQGLIRNGVGSLPVPAIRASQFAFYREVIDRVAFFDLVLQNSIAKLPIVVSDLMIHWQRML